MKEILLKSTKYGIKTLFISDEDIERVSTRTWFLRKSNNTFYVFSNERIDAGSHTTIQLHRFLIGAKKGEDVDHIDGNGLNNQRNNLRICTHSQNLMNAGISPRNMSGVVGVSWDKRRRRWSVHIRVEYKSIGIGRYKDFEDAVKARKDAEIKYFGKFRRN